MVNESLKLGVKSTFKKNTDTKGGFNSENLRFGIPKNISKSYLKFIYPVHDIDKMSILNILTLQI